MSVRTRATTHHLAVALVTAVGLLAGCTGGGSASPSAELEFQRHLRLGLDQMRRHLLESAEAEFAACARLRPDDPDLLYHQARLRLLGRGTPSGVAGALPLLKEAARRRPGSVKVERLLYELSAVTGDPQGALAHRQAVETAYGAIGSLEMKACEAFLKGGAFEVPKPPEAGDTSDYAILARSLAQLLREGHYNPGEAVPALEKLLARYPDLALVRLWYARQLSRFEVRINYSDREDQPKMSSRLTLGYAQSQLERAYDLSNPVSPIGLEAHHWLSFVALQMGDYDDVVTYADAILAVPSVDAATRADLLAQQGLSRYKQRRYDDARHLLEKALLGDPRPFPVGLPQQWVLHLAQDAAGTPVAERKFDFHLRPDLVPPATVPALHFRDVAAQYHLDKYDGLGPSAWGDYDGDGDFDLYVSGLESYGALYRNDGDHFTDVSVEAGLFKAQSGFSATFVDYDNDGWPDLYVGRDGWNGPAPNSLYHNDGKGHFEDVTAKAGVGDPGSSFVHSWADVDRDGFLDLYVADGITGAGDTNRFYHNNGDGTFSDWTERAGLSEPSSAHGTIGVAFGDYDDDGWPDLFVSGFQRLNRLYHNRGDGRFEEVAERAGVAGADSISTGYVCFFGDFDGDGRLDILRTSLAPWRHTLLGLSADFATMTPEYRRRTLVNCPKLYHNNGNGTFSDVSEKAGFIYPMGVMGATVADVDNDGWLDVYFGTGDPEIKRLEPDRFYRNNGDGSFQDVTFASGLGNIGKGHGITTVDIDGDGDLEIYAQEGGFVHGDLWANAFYLNEQTTGNHWLHVDLVGTKSNRAAVGTRLVATVGKRKLVRELGNGEGFGCSNSPTVEFGLGRLAKVDRLEVRWPSGAEQRFDDVPVDARIVVVEGQAWKRWTAH